jgi:hypothetical protein
MSVRSAFVALLVAGSALLAAQGQPDESWLTWTPQVARDVGRGARVTGRVGGFWGIRGLHTERAMNYELRVTWLTPEVLRASARMAQIRDRRPATDARKWVADAESMFDTAVIVELDPREGSGVIPLDWAAYLQPRGAQPGDGRSVQGVPIGNGRDYPALAGLEKRDYDFDIFWVGFALRTDAGAFLFDGAAEAEVVVRVQHSEGRVALTVPPSIRTKGAPRAR